MKKSIPKVRERESEASILGNDREREFPLTPEVNSQPDYVGNVFYLELIIGEWLFAHNLSSFPQASPLCQS